MVDINDIFKEFDSSDINTNVIERQAVYAWLFPDRRQSGSQPISKDTLEDFALRPGVPSYQPGDPIPQVDNGGQNERYFYRVYDDTDGIRVTEEATQPQFYVTYGNRGGEGAPDVANIPVTTNPTEGIYNQYAQLLRQEDYFFEDSPDDDFYAVNFDTSVFEERLRNGEWELTLNFDGQELKLVDESVTDPSGFFDPNDSREEVHEIKVVPGDLDNRTIQNNPSFTDGPYGYIYPAVGIIVLNTDALVEEASAGGTSSVETILPDTRDPQTIFNASGPLEVQNNNGFEWVGGFGGSISAAESEFADWPFVRNHGKLFDVIDAGGSFRAQGEVTIIEVNFNVTAEQDEFNYSLNPSYSDDSGNITFPNDSGSYITTIGLYDDDYRLVAVAKISPPEFKDFGDTFSTDVNLEF